MCDVSGFPTGFPYPDTFDLGGIPSNSRRRQISSIVTKGDYNHERRYITDLIFITFLNIHICPGPDILEPGFPQRFRPGLTFFCFPSLTHTPTVHTRPSPLAYPSNLTPFPCSIPQNLLRKPLVPLFRDVALVWNPYFLPFLML